MIRTLVVFASLLSLVVLLIRLVRLPYSETPSLAIVYLFFQAVFTLLALIAGLRCDWQGKTYEQVFFGSLWVALAFALALAFCFLLGVPWRSFVVIVGVGVVLA